MKRFLTVIESPPLLNHPKNQKVKLFCMNGFFVIVFLVNSPSEKIIAPIRRSIDRSNVALSVMDSNKLYPNDKQASING